MSLVTRCPACGTAFKVVADQLKISDGWVRCGQCQHVFDGNEHLLQAFDASTQHLPAEQPFASTAPALDETWEAQSTAAHVTDTWPVAPESVAAVAPADAIPEQTDLQADHHAFDAPEAAPLTFVSVPEGAYFSEEHEPELSVLVPAEEPAPQANNFPSDPLTSEWHRWPEGDFGPVPSNPHELDFVRRAQRKAVWRHPAVRAGLWLALLGLLLGLAWQLVGQHHAWLMSRVPAMTPVLTQVCQRLGCEVQPQQDIDHIAMDSSALLRKGGGHYVFEMVVKNTANLPLATPALELTLTGQNDQVLSRKVFMPTEWPQPRTSVAPQSDWTVRLELAYVGADVAAVQGYHAVLFYP